MHPDLKGIYNSIVYDSTNYFLMIVSLGFFRGKTQLLM